MTYKCISPIYAFRTILRTKKCLICPKRAGVMHTAYCIPISEPNLFVVLTITKFTVKKKFMKGRAQLVFFHELFSNCKLRFGCIIIQKCKHTFHHGKHTLQLLLYTHRCRVQNDPNFLAAFLKMEMASSLTSKKKIKATAEYERRKRSVRSQSDLETWHQFGFRLPSVPNQSKISRTLAKKPN